MIRCLKDPNISEDSKCAYCCLYCSDKEYCDYYCPLAKECKTEKDIIDRDCVHAYEED